MKLAKADQEEEKQRFYEGAAWLGRQMVHFSEDQVNKVEDVKLKYN